YTCKGLQENDYVTPTAIQKESIGLSLRGYFGFPHTLLELLHRRKWTKLDGLGGLVITPTRELAYQIFETLRKVGKHHEFSAGLVIGGKDLHYETKRLATCNIVICTPGRLLQHMDENAQFDPVTLQILVLDEADRCLDLGFAETMNAIFDNLPKERQTLLFSATQTRSVKDLARLGLKDPVYISTHEHSQFSTPDQLTQNYLVCDYYQKMDMLLSFLKNHRKSKTLVFVQSCKQARYLQELFKRLRVGVTVLGLYGTLHQLRRMSIYEEFCQEERSIVLIATDIAARGLDFPKVDWVFQLDCPKTAKHIYIGLLVLTLSEEEGMKKQFSIHKIPIEKIEVNPKKLTTCQMKIEANLAGDKNLKEMASRAFHAYLKSIYLMKNKAIFDVFQIDLDKYARSLGLMITPKVRFLKKQLKKQDNNKKSAIVVSDSEDEDDDGDVLTIKRKDHDLEQEDTATPEEELVMPERVKKNKVVTKASLAKKVLKKKLSMNNVMQFNEDGDVVLDNAKSKMSELGQEYEKTRDECGINVELAKEVLKAEDKFDKKIERAKIKERHREERKRLKELKNKRKKEMKETCSDGDSEEDENALDWLPDPDVIYGKVTQSGSSEDESQSSESEDESSSAPPKKAKEVIRKRSKKSDELPQTSLAEDEDLALKLLQASNEDRDKDANKDKENCSLIEVPFDLPPEVPNLYEVEYKKRDSTGDARPRLTIHVEVNRTGVREGARRYSNVNIWTEGYNDPPAVFSDVMDELKVHDDKVKQNLEKNCSPLTYFSDGKPPLSFDTKQNSTQDGSGFNVSAQNSQNKIQYSSGNNLSGHIQDPSCEYLSTREDYDNPIMGSSIHPNESTPNSTRRLELTETPLDVSPQTSKHSQSIKSKKGIFHSRDVTCYSLGYQGFAIKYSRSKGSCIVTADQDKPTKILGPGECAMIMIKIDPNKPAKIKVIR
ncbi:RNA helicase, partial [Caligus rogercresseyi]